MGAGIPPLVTRYLGQLPQRAHFLLIGEVPPAWSGLAPERTHAIPSCPPAEFGAVLQAADAVLSLNMAGTTVWRAALSGVPAMVLGNDFRIRGTGDAAAIAAADAAVGGLSPFVRGALPGCLPLHPFRMWPLAFHSFLAPLLRDNPYTDAFAHAQVLDEASVTQGMESLLFDKECRATGWPPRTATRNRCARCRRPAKFSPQRPRGRQAGTDPRPARGQASRRERYGGAGHDGDNPGSRTAHRAVGRRKPQQCRRQAAVRRDRVRTGRPPARRHVTRFCPWAPDPALPPGSGAGPVSAIRPLWVDPAGNWPGTGAFDAVVAVGGVFAGPPFVNFLMQAFTLGAQPELFDPRPVVAWHGVGLDDSVATAGRTEWSAYLRALGRPPRPRHRPRAVRRAAVQRGGRPGAAHCPRSGFRAARGATARGGPVTAANRRSGRRSRTVPAFP